MMSFRPDISKLSATLSALKSPLGFDVLLTHHDVTFHPAKDMRYSLVIFQYFLARLSKTRSRLKAGYFRTPISNGYIKADPAVPAQIRFGELVWAFYEIGIEIACDYPSPAEVFNFLAVIFGASDRKGLIMSQRPLAFLPVVAINATLSLREFVGI